MVACLGPIGAAGRWGCSRVLMAATVIAGLTVAAWAPAATAAGGWHAPVTLSAAGDVFGPAQVAMDRAGNATAVWTAFGRRSSDTSVAQAATRPAGGSFSRPVNLSKRSAEYADVAMNPAGDTVAIWSGIAAVGLQAAIRPVGGSFSLPARLSADDSVGIALATDQAGGAIIVWDGAFADRGVHAVVRSAGGGFSKPVNLGDGDGLSPQVAIDQAGDAIVVWEGLPGTSSGVQAVLRPAGGSFSKPVNLSADRQRNHGALVLTRDAQVAIDQAGNAIVVWTRYTGKRSVVRAVLRPAGGRFSKPVNLSTQRQNAYDAQVAIDQAGNAIVVWARSRGKRSVVQAVLRPAGGSFSKPVNLSRVSKRGDVSPEVAINPSGDAVVGWVRHVTKSGIWRVQAAMRPAGGDFSKPVNLSPAFRDKGGFTVTPDVAISPSGSAIVVWNRDIGKRSIAQAATYDAAARGQATALRSPRDALALWGGS